MSLANSPSLTGPDPVNDGRHRLLDLPLERESMPYIISLPDLGVATTIYTWVTNENLAGAIFVACGPGIGAEPIIEAVDGIDVGPEANFDDWTVGPVRVAHQLDLMQARIHGAGERIALDATFSATHPAYAYSAHADGCPPFAAADRLEQSGRVTGTFTLDGVTHAFDTTAARDHSWGTRDWEYAQHWKWVHAQTADTALHFWQIHMAGSVELRGYLVRDGRMAEVTEVSTAFTVDGDNRQQTITADVTDAEGRKARLTGEYFAHFDLAPIPACTLVEGGMRCEIDGGAGTGWSEFMWPTSYLEHLRSQTHT